MKRLLFVLFSVLLSSVTCFAIIGESTADLVKELGKPEKTVKTKGNPYWTEYMVFKKNGQIIKACIYQSRVCAVVYGNEEINKSLAEADRVIILNNNSNGEHWKTKVITDPKIIEYTRGDGKAYAVYHNSGKRPYLNIMTDGLWKFLKEKHNLDSASAQY